VFSVNGKNRVKSRRAAALGATVLAIAGFIAAGPSKQPVVAQEDAVDELDYVIDLNEFVPELEQRLGGRLGGVRIDRQASPAQIVVSVSRPTAADHQTARATAGRAASRIRVVPAAASGAEIAALKSDVISLLHENGISPAAVQFDEVTGKLRVLSRGLSPAAETAVRQRVPAPLLEVVNDPTFSPRFTHVDRAQYPPYEAGLILTLGGAQLLTN
jgi:hypothetical protein